MTIKVNNRVIMQAVHFIENLQVHCILGMHFMKRARITIDVSRKCIKMGKPIKLSAHSPLAKIADSSSELQMFPLQECLTITNGRPRLEKIDHVEKIDLSHLPEPYRQRYKSLLRANADVFSRKDLDVGHCKSLPHKVRLRDPNRITAINQYHLPFHLKEVAIDYVKKLLQAGVVRKSTSIFNSPLMLVKKPHADPNKPRAEQYRLVTALATISRRQGIYFTDSS